jgi:hypothetical protein
MKWTNGSSSDHCQVGAPAVCKYGNACKNHRSYPGTRAMEVSNANLWAIGLMVREVLNRSEILHDPRAKMVIVISNSQFISP